MYQYLFNPRASILSTKVLFLSHAWSDELVSRTKYTYATGGKYVAISTPYTAEYTPYTAECSNPWISRVVEESRVDFHLYISVTWWTSRDWAATTNRSATPHVIYGGTAHKDSNSTSKGPPRLAKDLTWSGIESLVWFVLFTHFGKATLENVRAQETLASAITIFMGCTSVSNFPTHHNKHNNKEKRKRRLQLEYTTRCTLTALRSWPS